MALQESWEDATWRNETRAWAAHHEEALGRQLARVKQFVAENEHAPARLARHFDSVLALLQQAHGREHLETELPELVLRLHPWPVRWGRWDAWQDALALTTSLAAKHGDADAEIALRTHLSELMASLGRLEEALETATRAAAQAQRLNAIVWTAQAGSQVIDILTRLGRVAESEERQQAFDAAIAAANGSIKEITLAQAHLIQPRLLQLKREGQYQAAIALANHTIQALTAIAPAESPLLARALQNRANLYWSTRQHTLAIADLQEATALFDNVGDAFASAATQASLGLIYYTLCRFTDAERAMRSALNMAEALNARNRLAEDVGNLAAVCLAQGRLHQALAYLDRQEQLARETGNAHQLSRAQGNRATVQLCLGQFEAALDSLESSLAMFEAQKRTIAVVASLIELSWCYQGLEQQQKAETKAKDAYRLACEQGEDVLRMFALRRLHFVDAHPGQPLLLEALAIARAHERHLDVAATLLLLAGSEQTQAEKERWWQEGREILQEIGAEAWLQDAVEFQAPEIPYLL